MHDVIQRNMFGFFCFFLRTQTSLRSGSAARLASPSRAASPSHLLEDLLGDHIFNSHFLHREQRSPSGEVGHSEVWWTQRLKQSWKKNNLILPFLILWPLNLTTLSSLRFSPQALPSVATHWARPLSFPSTTLIISPSLPTSLLAINFVPAWKIHHVGGLIRAGVFCQGSSCVWTFWTFNSLSF